MTQITVAPDLKKLIRGAHSLLVVATDKTLTTRRMPRLFGARIDKLLVELAKDASPGDTGNVSSTLTGKDPRRLIAGVLPEKVSRYNSAARTECVKHVVGAARLGTKGRAAVLLVLDEASHVTAAVNALGRALPQYSAKSGKGSTLKVQIHAVDRSGASLEIGDLPQSILRASRDSAELVDTPPTELNPAEFAARAKAALKTIPNVKVSTIVGDKLLAEGLAGIHGVGRAAKDAPRMLIATYTPPESEDTNGKSKGKYRHVALVGKGVTYDTGGLHLKARGMMEGMKCDMGGAAAVYGAFRVLAENGCQHQVSLVMCLAENAIGPASYKPDDVLTMHSGKTVEINNTDAEGRLLLADGVSYAARVLGADTVFDAATLTGAQLISTGVAHAAIVSNQEELERSTLDAGHASGDLAHPLPFAPELFRAEFKSVVADMCNSVRNRMNAQSACAAQFVYAHLEGTKTNWCHVDLAGPAFRKERGTGYGVALLATTVLGLE